ncbi:GNAT family N-acetyltransferase [Bacillus cytotoxicus]
MLERIENIGQDNMVHILKLAVGPSEPSLQKVIHFYTENQQAILYKCGENACVGMELIGENKARLCHIAVSKANCHQGLASYMIKEIIRIHQLIYVEAETDCEAVEFYRKCGWGITSLGEKYPGVERFQCYWE